MTQIILPKPDGGARKLGIPKVLDRGRFGNASQQRLIKIAFFQIFHIEKGAHLSLEQSGAD